MNIIKQLLVSSLAIFFVACEPVEEVGPSICPGENFDFSADDIKLYRVGSSGTSEEVSDGDLITLDTSGLRIVADFKKEFLWDLTISKGSFEKTYSGEDSIVDVFWYGQPDKFDGTNISFSEGKVNIDLKIVCKDLITRNVNIKGKQTFKGIDHSFGMLLRDYDKNGASPVRNDSYFFLDGLVNFSPNNVADSNEVYYTSESPSPAGGNSVVFKAAQADPTWYYGFTQFNIENEIDLLQDVSPDEIYLNFFAKKLIDAPNVPANVGFRIEGEDLMLYQEEITWDGWNYVSIPLSDFRNSNTDDPLSNVSDINWFAINLGSFPLQSRFTGVSYDMFLLTLDKPLFE